MASSEADTVIVNLEDSRSGSPPTLLPPPIQSLEESPSKWGLRKTSEKNLSKTEPKRVSGGDPVMSPRGNAHELFMVSRACKEFVTCY